jgi:hypothetical protein
MASPSWLLTSQRPAGTRSPPGTRSVRQPRQGGAQRRLALAAADCCYVRHEDALRPDGAARRSDAGNMTGPMSLHSHGSE